MTNPDLKIVYVSPDVLEPHPKNPRKHSRHQVRSIRQSYLTFDFNDPILAMEDGTIIAGHGRWEAAKAAGLTRIPIINLPHLDKDKAAAFMLADNKLAEMAKWDDPLLADVIKELAGKELEFDLEDTGFQTTEIDRMTRVLDEPGADDTWDDYEVSKVPAVTMVGDAWKLGEHVVVCGNATDAASYFSLPQSQFATMVFTDPPWNFPVNGHISGNGDIEHREFAKGSGEMTPEEFKAFLSRAIERLEFRCDKGALLYLCIDWRNFALVLGIAQSFGFTLINVCIWVKHNGGMGSLYRSQYEMVMVFRKGETPHQNNVQLGRNGRNRTNVWEYPGATVPVKGKRPLEYHPTPKPVKMVIDAIADCTKKGALVMDPFLGSGTTLLAAERTGRKAYGIEIDPLYVDTTIRRWEKMTGRQAKHIKIGKTFAEISAERLPDGE